MRGGELRPPTLLSLLVLLTMTTSLRSFSYQGRSLVGVFVATQHALQRRIYNSHCRCFCTTTNKDAQALTSLQSKLEETVYSYMSSQCRIEAGSPMVCLASAPSPLENRTFLLPINQSSFNLLTYLFTYLPTYLLTHTHTYVTHIHTHLFISYYA